MKEVLLQDPVALLPEGELLFFFTRFITIEKIYN